MRTDEIYFVEDTFMGQTALLDAFAQSDLDMRGFNILNAGNFGTVTSVGVAMPAQFSVSGSPITEAGVIVINWNLGGPDIPLGVLPFAAFGANHTAGIVPDPGATGSGNPSDYLGRDMLYHPISGGGGGGGGPLPYPYQPFVPNPVLSIGSPTTGPANENVYPVTVTESLAGTSLFYSVNNSAGGFAPLTGGTFNLYAGQVGYVYGAKVGYNNSAIVFIQAAPPPGQEVVTGDDGLPVTGDDGANVTVGGPAPPNVTATAGNGQVALNWAANDPSATGYTVHRGTASGSYDTTFSVPSGTSYTDTTVTNGTQYFYSVTATTPTMSSGYSNQVSATPSAS
jgi:hypothetical protein